MAKTIVGLFDTFDEAQEVVQDLVNEGFDRKDISLVANNAGGEYSSSTSGSTDDTLTTDGHGDKVAESAGTGAVGGTVVGGVLGLLVGVGALAIPGIGPVVAAGQLATVLGSTALGAGIGAAAGGLIGALVGMGVPEEEANYYAEGVRRGGTLVTVKSEDDMADRAYAIMQDHDAVDINERGATWQQSGWGGFDASAQPYTGEEVENYRNNYRQPDRTATNTATMANTNTRTTDDGEAVIPVVEEDINISKRQVQRGGARIYTQTTERPVEENIQLREEHVNVERRPVDRPATQADMNAFREGTMEVRETAEEAVVAKQPRVVEEVVVDKDVDTRTETVRDTVRRTDVDVERIDGSDVRDTRDNRSM